MPKVCIGFYTFMSRGAGQMRRLDRCALGVSVAAAMLASCSGVQPPSGAPGAMPQSWVITTQDARHMHSAPLLYVTNSPSVVNHK